MPENTIAEKGASMTLIIGMVSQKGGVGKSTLARLVAREYAQAGWQVKIADLDISQGTSTDWKKRREQNGYQPEVAVEPFRTVAQVGKVAELYDLVVLTDHHILCLAHWKLHAVVT